MRSVRGQRDVSSLLLAPERPQQAVAESIEITGHDNNI
jgi:hypothetical protein